MQLPKQVSFQGVTDADGRVEFELTATTAAAERLRCATVRLDGWCDPDSTMEITINDVRGRLSLEECKKPEEECLFEVESCPICVPGVDGWCQPTGRASKILFPDIAAAASFRIEAAIDLPSYEFTAVSGTLFLYFDEYYWNPPPSPRDFGEECAEARKRHRH
jgi:hypothetical protein